MPKFSICLIARNEEKTLPRLLASLQEFKERNGEVVLLDTGSSDRTAEIAREWGCKVEEVGDRFVRYVDHQMAKKINREFKVLGDKDIVKEGDKNFDFSSARNYCASLASNDMVSMPDCDEIFTKLYIFAMTVKRKKDFTQTNMINPNNYNQLASSLSDVLDRIINPEDLKKLSEPQRNYLTVLIRKWSEGEEVIATIKSILGITPKPFSKYSEKTTWYLKTKQLI